MARLDPEFTCKNLLSSLAPLLMLYLGSPCDLVLLRRSTFLFGEAGGCTEASCSKAGHCVAAWSLRVMAEGAYPATT